MQGLVLLNKPSGITSYGAVAGIKRLTGEKRVGHTGILDPMATGVLPIFIGRATALCGLLLDADKRYTAVIKLGISTDTNDITGNVTDEKNVTASKEDIERAVKHFTGEIVQKPPIYSAIKQDGERLYEKARRGETADIPTRAVTVYKAEILSFNLPESEFTVDFHVSKGTYIRSLARDIGEFLGCGACLSALCRTYTGGFSLPECVSREMLTENNISDYVLSEETAVGYLREICVTEKQAIRFSNGGQLDFDRLKVNDFAEGELFRVKSGGLFLGVGRADTAKNQLAVKCVINYPGDVKK